MRFAIVLILFAAVACRNRVPPVAQTTSEYMDLVAGGKLSVIVPMVRGGGFVPNSEIESQSGSSIGLSSKDLIGFEVSHYALQGAEGKVSLEFRSAEISREGIVSQQRKAPKLPIALPPRRQHVRLIYFVRSSQADHNMAIAASKNMSELAAFTKSLRLDPSVCRIDETVFCVWVPLGVAVRAE